MSSNLGGGSEPKSPARTPSSENKSFDSALSSGIASECCSSSTTATSSNRGSSGSNFNVIGPVPENEVTPVNTLQRSGSVCPSTSSSSGCLSDRSSNTSFNIPNEHGFESDFPAGGTIKKRPSLNPRIPLTNTTWGLVGGSDNDDENAANVRVGGGGTLLRHSLRRKNSRDRVDAETTQIPRHHRVYAQVHREPVAVPPPSLPPPSIDQLSAEFETSLNGVQEVDCENEEYDEDEIPLPPPPRAESMDLGALVSPTQALMPNTPGSEIDDLPPPPPPPEMSVDENPYHISPVLHSPPALPHPSLLKQSNGFSGQQQNRSTGTLKRITFNDNVQLIGVSSPTEDDEEQYEPWCPKNIVTEPPKKLSMPADNFIKDLQRVMTKKWQIAERCRGDETSPHQVLGFRDLDMKDLVGTGHEYSRDNTVGAWVLHSQRYAAGHNQKPSPQYQQQHHQEPLYAISTKVNHHPQQQQQQPQMQHNNSGRVLSPPPPAPSVTYAPPNVRLPPAPPAHRPPVILREPTPEYDHYSANGYHHVQQQQQQLQQQQQSPRSYCASPGSNHSGGDMSNYSTLMFSSELPYSNGFHSPVPPPQQNFQNFSRGSPSTSSLQKRAPPPPRRSETTHLTSTS